MKHGKKILELTVEPWEQSISKIALEQSLSSEIW